MPEGNNNVISKNLPIYFIWFGSDIPPKYFSNLQKAAKTNKSRDIILVYSDKHLLEDNRKNIDSMESISISKIKNRIKLKEDSRTKNLFKIDVYDMELDKQDERIYPLLNQIFSLIIADDNGVDMKSAHFCVASDLIRLPLLNITGGIYFDMDAKITGEIGIFNSKNGFNIFYYYHDDDQLHISSDPLIKNNMQNNYFNELMKGYFYEIKKILANESNYGRGSDPVNYLSSCICKPRIESYNRKYEAGYKNETDNQKIRLKLWNPIIADYGIDVPPTIKLKMEMGEGYHMDYNNPEDLKKLDLDKTDYVSSEIASSLSNLSLESVRSSEERSR